MFENDMIQNLQEMREVAVNHYKLLCAAYEDSRARTRFCRMTDPQIDLAKQRYIAKNAIIALDQLLATNKLLSDFLKDQQNDNS